MLPVQVFIRHDVDPELRGYMEGVKTENSYEVVGDFAIMKVEDLNTLQPDIMKILRQADKIKILTKRLGWPWMVKEVLDKRAVEEGGKLRYLRPKNIIRKEIENELKRAVSDDEFREILDMVTKDIIVNRLTHNKLTPMPELIKIAAQCARTLKKCGG